MDIKVGVISDTHGLLRQEALEALQGSDLILHAGDIGPQEILASLEDIAAVYAVRGNMDGAHWWQALPETRSVDAGSARIYMIHDLALLAKDPVHEGYAAVISGHSHLPKVEYRNGVLLLNPGSAGPRRFRLPVTLATFMIADGSISPPEIKQLLD